MKKKPPKFDPKKAKSDILGAVALDRLFGKQPDATRVAAHAYRVLSERYGLPMSCIYAEIDPTTGAVEIIATPHNETTERIIITPKEYSI